MKKILSLFCVTIICLAGQAQRDNKIVVGIVDSLYSQILKEPRKIWVHVPDSGPDGLFSQQRYPVLYLLDGDAHFFSVLGMIQQLSGVNGNMLMPPMIVVGITNTNRTRDLTPSQVSNAPFMNPAESKNSGGGEKFMSFMEKELIPHIDSLYPTQPYKTLVGHSLGGLMVMYALIQHPQLFNAYVSIDPSMWWDKQSLFNTSKNMLASKRYQGKSLYLGIANTMEEGMDIKKVGRDTSENTAHIRAILELDKFLQQNSTNGLKYKSHYYADDSHGSVPLITEYDALRFIFDFYNLKLGFKDFQDTTAALADKVEKHFQQVSQKMGYTIKPSENQVNGMGYQALNEKKFKLAERFFKMNVSNYPASFNVYDSLGDYYQAAGDKQKAIESFKKSLSIQEVGYTRDKLKQLETK